MALPSTRRGTSQPDFPRGLQATLEEALLEVSAGLA